MTERDMMSQELEAKVIERMKAAYKFNRFLNYTLSGEN